MFLRSDAPSVEPDGVTEAVENPHDRQILAMTQEEASTAQEIIDATGISKSTAYRRIQRLQELGLLGVQAGGIKAGHPVEIYRARVEMAQLTIEAGGVEARWRLLERPEERLHRLWSHLAGGGA